MYLKDLELTKEDEILRVTTKDRSAISINTAKSRIMRKFDEKQISYGVAGKHLKLIKDISDDSAKSQISIRVNKSFQSLLLDCFDSERAYQEELLKNEKNPRGKHETKLNIHEKSVAYVRAVNNFVERISAIDEKDNQLYTLTDTVGVDIVDKIYNKYNNDLKYFLFPSSEKFNYQTVKYLEKSGIMENQSNNELEK